MATYPATHLNNPVVYKDRFRYNRGDDKAWFTWQPLASDPNYVRFMNDFTKATDYNTTDFTLTTTNAGSVVVKTTSSSLNGAVAIITDATGTDTTQIQAKQDAWQLVFGTPKGSNYSTAPGPGTNSNALGKRFWYEANVSLTAPTTTDMFVGMQPINTNAISGTQAGMGFRVATGSAQILLQAYQAAGTSINASTIVLGNIAMPSATYTKLGMYFDGNAVQFFVNRQYAGTIKTNLPTAVFAPVLYAGDNATAAQTLLVDYVNITSER